MNSTAQGQRQTQVALFAFGGVCFYFFNQHLCVSIKQRLLSPFKVKATSGYSDLASWPLITEKPFDSFPGAPMAGVQSCLKDKGSELFLTCLDLSLMVKQVFLERKMHDSGH